MEETKKFDLNGFRFFWQMETQTDLKKQYLKKYTMIWMEEREFQRTKHYKSSKDADRVCSAGKKWSSGALVSFYAEFESNWPKNINIYTKTLYIDIPYIKIQFKCANATIWRGKGFAVFDAIYSDVILYVRWRTPNLRYFDFAFISTFEQ